MWIETLGCFGGETIFGSLKLPYSNGRSGTGVPDNLFFSGQAGAANQGPAFFFFNINIPSAPTLS